MSPLRTKIMATPMTATYCNFYKLYTQCLPHQIFVHSAFRASFYLICSYLLRGSNRVCEDMHQLWALNVHCSQSSLLYCTIYNVIGPCQSYASPTRRLRTAARDSLARASCIAFLAPRWRFSNGANYTHDHLPIIRVNVHKINCKLIHTNYTHLLYLCTLQYLVTGHSQLCSDCSRIRLYRIRWLNVYNCYYAVPLARLTETLEATCCLPIMIYNWNWRGSRRGSLFTVLLSIRVSLLPVC